MFTTKELVVKLFYQCYDFSNKKYPYNLEILDKSVTITTFEYGRKSLSKLEIPRTYLNKAGFSISLVGRNIIFVKDSLRDFEKYRVILHELGHILKGHTVDEKGLLGNSSDAIIHKKEEKEAEEFADCYMTLVDESVKASKTNAGNKIMRPIIIGGAACLLSVAVWLGGNLYPNSPQRPVSVISTETPTETKTQAPEPTHKAIVITETPTQISTPVPTPASTAKPKPASTQTIAPTENPTPEPTIEPTATQTADPTAEPIIVTETPGVIENGVYITKSGKKFHKEDCYHIKNSNTTKLATNDAINGGYAACLDCRPLDE